VTVEAIGVDLGGTKMLVGVVDSERNVVYRATAPSMGLGQDELIATLERELEAAVDARPEVAGVGLGIPSTIDRERGMAVTTVNLELADVPIRDLIAQHIDRPVILDNDANGAILAEHRFGAAQGAENAVMLTIGTGIGGALVIGGEVYRGSTGAAAELGHVVVDADGPPCQGSCPNHGCVEVMASGTAIAREGLLAAERAPDSALGRAVANGVTLDGKEVTDAAREGDPIAVGVLETAGRWLGVALASFANIFDPDVIVLGGGVMQAGDLLAEPARRELANRALAPMNRTPVVAAALGQDAGMVGAATLAMLELDGRAV
jgi:glucokinase